MAPTMKQCPWLIAAALSAGILFGQVVPHPLAVNQTRYKVTAGGSIPIDAPAEAISFMLSAKTRVARASTRTFPVAPNVAGDRVVLGIPLTTAPGDYTVSVDFINDSNEERSTPLQVTVEPFAKPEATTAAIPVVLLDGWQAPSAVSACPIANDSTTTFGNLASYLSGSPNSVPAVFFFQNCVECPQCTIEQLGVDLGTFLNSLQYSNGATIPLVDVVAHSMGGLIVRSYLSGKQVTSGSFIPPTTTLIRKAIFLGTPHFGSFQTIGSVSSALFTFGSQMSEMEPASQFVWDQATWNQFGDDLRGVDALAVVGNAGAYLNLASASDGLVVLSSGAIDFASPGRTRVVGYCHVPLPSGSTEAGYLGCAGPGLAYIDSTSHLSYEIISSFLLDTTAWQSLGTAPAKDPYLSKYGGMIVADIDLNDQYATPSTVTWGSVTLTTGAAGDLYYNDLIFGTGTFNFGAGTCGPYSQPLGYYAIKRCKFATAITSVGPLLAGSGKVVQSGAAITITGGGFGATKCTVCKVTLSNGQVTTLQTTSWSDTTIKTTLPADYTGVATLGVTAAAGIDNINIMIGSATAPPTISLSPTTLTFAFTMGGAAPTPQTVAVTNTGGGTLSYTLSSSATWLTATESGNTITAAVDPTGLTPNTYQGTITITAAGASNTPQTIGVTLTVAATPPTLTIGAIAHSATGLQGAVAPGELVSIYGTNLGPATGVQFSVDPATGMVDTNLAGTMVVIGSVAAPLTYSSATQVNAIVPYEVSGQSQAVMVVQYQGGSVSQTLQVASASPGAYTLNSSGSGPVVAANQDGTINGPSNPAAKGSFVTIYFTGGGQTNPPGVTGSVTGPVLKTLTQPVSVTVGGQPATVSFAGSAPTLVDGVDQLNIQLAANTPSGAQTVTIAVGGIASPSTVTLAVQ